jgi:hypothetical protein
MTFVLNKCYGGFSLSDFAVEKLGVEDEYSFLDELEMDALASLIREFGSEKCSGRNANLQVVEIPDICTDYGIDEYDGFEVMTYVVNGKLCHA